MTVRRSVLAALAVAIIVAPAFGHEGRPVQVQIKEREPGAFLVQWRVPKVLPVQAMPVPVLPESCRPEGERVFLDQPSGWMNRQVFRCSEGLAGQTIGIAYPMPNTTITTVLHVEFLSGERFAHALAPQEESWRLPEANVGALAAWLKDARRAALTGAGHVLGHWVHVAFLLAVVLLGGALGSLRLVTAFAVGQFAAVALTAVLGRAFDPAPAEICAAVAVAFLAREALRTVADRRRVDGLAGGAGLFHGLALAGLLPAAQGADGVAWSYLLVLVLGMDAALLVLAVGLAGVGRAAARRAGKERLRPAVTYLVGATAVAAALVLAFGGATSEVAEQTYNPRLPGVSATASSVGLPGSRRISPRAPDAPIQSYLAVEGFEVRHEVLVRLRDVAADLDLALGADGHLEIATQDDVARQAARYVDAATVVEIDGERASGIIDRVLYVTVDAQGVWPRPTPVRESVDEAIVGVTIVYLTQAVPETVALAWESYLDGAPAIPATVIDPEVSRSTILTAGQPRLRWENELLENPITTVSAVAVEAVELPLPLVSMLLFGAAVVLFVLGTRGWQRATSFSAARVALALALIAGPLAQVAIALPASVGSVPSANSARRILASVLPNVYRAFEFRDEGMAYDRLAVAVTGATLTDIYLEHRRSLEMEERGGARARVDAVEVVDVREVEPREDGGFDAEATWTVGGTVTHFGHRHFRQNRYDTRVAVVAVDGVWKIRSIEVLEQERIR